MPDHPTTHETADAEVPEEKPPRSIGDRIVSELKVRPVAWVTAAILLVLAPVILKMIFPDATAGMLVAGTIAFAAYGAACTVPGRFL